MDQETTMRLNYKMQTYAIKAVRQVVITPRADGGWVASLPAFGLMAVAGTRDDAHDELEGQLVVYLHRARRLGWALPVIDDIDPNDDLDDDDLTESQVAAIDGLAEHAVVDFDAGKAMSIEDFARENNVMLDAG
jgi:predicted RNase H-like HicB family nuclease